MLQLTPQSRVFVALEPADFRCGIDGLAALCRQRLREDPFAGTIFVFRNRRGTALKLARDWVSPGDIVGSALGRLRAVLAPLQVHTDVPAQLPLLYVHAALIEQALVNVLENAARFSPPHGRLQVSAGVADEQLFFAVADEGPGIPEDERAKIFDMFYTAARGDRGGQGTGLGLAICQGMVGAHGGHIRVEDGIEGRGTCISLFLPLPTQPGPEREP